MRLMPEAVGGGSRYGIFARVRVVNASEPVWPSGKALGW